MPMPIFIQVCKEVWDAAVAEDPEIEQEITLAEFMEEVRVDFESLTNVNCLDVVS